MQRRATIVKNAVDRGVYRHPNRVRVPADPEYLEAARDLLTAQNEQYDIEAQLGQAEQFANAVLSKYEIRQPLQIPDTLPGDIKRELKAANRQYPKAASPQLPTEHIPHNATEQVEVAQHILASTQIIRRHVEAVRSLQVDGIRLGQLVEMLRVMQVEEPALKGKRSRMGAHRGGARHKEQSQHKHVEWQKLANKIWATRPSRSVLCVARWIARETGDNPETIRKHIHRPVQ